MIISYTAVNYVNGKANKIVVFPINTEDSFYHQSVKSLDAFIKREDLKIVSEHYVTLPNYTKCKLTNNFQIDEQHASHMYVDFQRVFVNSLWEMYLEINYDYKAKKYFGEVK